MSSLVRRLCGRIQYGRLIGGIVGGQFQGLQKFQEYAQKLQALKDDVNEMVRIVARLDEMRGSLSASDRDSLDHATALIVSTTPRRS